MLDDIFEKLIDKGRGGEKPTPAACGGSLLSSDDSTLGSEVPVVCLAVPPPLPHQAFYFFSSDSCTDFCTDNLNHYKPKPSLVSYWIC